MIKFKDVTKAFGDAIALEDISFQVEPGELVLITGPSGSGKTTLMKLMTKEYLPTEGEIFFKDTPLSEIKNRQLHLHRRNIGVIFQDYKLLPELNVWENIALALQIAGRSNDDIAERVTDLLNLVTLTDKAFHFPSQLSGGEAQRVSIARALAMAPPVIFADEPTGNLDAENSKSVATLLKKINELGTTVLFCTHDPDILEMLSGKRIIKIVKGKLDHDSHPHKDKKDKKENESKKENHHHKKESKHEEKEDKHQEKSESEADSKKESHQKDSDHDKSVKVEKV